MRQTSGTLACASLLTFLSACGGAHLPIEDAAPPPLKLYALECGRSDILDLGVLANDGVTYQGETGVAVVSCFLIRHPLGDFLWDAGLPDALHGGPDVVADGGAFKVSVPVTLRSQLGAIGVAPADIEYFSISHSHFDHVGNANLFTASNFIVHEDELAFMRAQTDQSAYDDLLKSARISPFTGQKDVFGDGSVVITPTPGHTPGHASLLVRLENEGSILLTGDLYHLSRARALKTVPTFNTDPVETRESMDAFEALAAETGARVIIQHEADDIASLPLVPAYLD